MKKILFLMLFLISSCSQYYEVDAIAVPLQEFNVCVTNVVDKSIYLNTSILFVPLSYSTPWVDSPMKDTVRWSLGKINFNDGIRAFDVNRREILLTRFFKNYIGVKCDRALNIQEYGTISYGGIDYTAYIYRDSSLNIYSPHFVNNYRIYLTNTFNMNSLAPEDKNVYRALINEMTQKGKILDITTQPKTNTMIYSNVITEISNLNYSVEIFSSQIITVYETLVSEHDNLGISHASLDGVIWTDFHFPDYYLGSEYTCLNEEYDGVNRWYSFSGMMNLFYEQMAQSELISTSPTNYYTKIYIRKAGTNKLYLNYNPITEVFGFAHHINDEGELIQ